MPNLNLCQFMGHIGQDPRVRKFDDGNKVANFSLAVSERYTDRSGEAKETTTWVDVTTFGKLADFVESYIGKGRAVYVQGRLRQRRYTTADGEDRILLEIVADRIEALDRPKDEQQKPQGRRPDAEPRVLGGKPKRNESLEPQSDDLPFSNRPGYSR